MREKWDARYAAHEHLYGSAPNAFIAKMVAELEFSGTSLAIAEGEGRNALSILEDAMRHNRPMTMLLQDYSSVGLSKAKARAESMGLTIETQCIDLNDAVWPSQHYDNIFCVFGHFEPALKDKTLRGIRESLKHEGWFVGEVYSTAQLAYQTGGPPVAELLYDVEDFLTVFANDRIHHLFLGEVIRSEGDLHNGLCHVIQFAIQVKKG